MPTNLLYRCGLTSMLLAASTCISAEAATFAEPADGCRMVGPSAAARSAVTSSAPVFPPPQLQIRTPFEPTAFPSAGLNYLIYEVHLQNFSDAAMKISGIEVLAVDAPGAKPIAAFEAQQLQSLLMPFGSEAASDEGDDGVRLAGGRAAVAFFCLAFEKGSQVPHRLSHRVVLENAVLDSTDVEVAHTPLRVLAPPVSGAGWIAANGPSNTSHHRLGLFTTEGAARISRRYAIDWKRLKDDASFAGDARDVRSYHAYAQDVLAVAEGTVVSTVDGMPDNVPRTAAGFSTAVPVTMESVPGNRVVLDLGGGQFAYYAHLQAGSIAVKKGDRVRRGQLLGRIGNSGDSREPHLHFQLANAPHILGAEGLPHVIDRYQLRAKSGTEERTRELPIRDMRVDFKEAKTR
ncbi:M23 family metallopeptidase [Archangium violaceum]|uniref:M23 family metallopeptidase n=1 Tax=Archangium violaceum TaxID=83451 RepID=UPI002B30F7D3|nr:M23 family metallopeptidase [Archangium violaceum]